MTRGVRNHNPLNIRAGSDWLGLSAVDKDGFCVFASDRLGLRAAFVLLSVYQRAHGLYTVQQIIKRWAPPSENDTTAYIDFIFKKTGWTREKMVNVDDFEDASRLVVAMAEYESKWPVNWYDVAWGFFYHK